jgi:2-keto-3-deoxy-L-rhamnonate aldolase
VQPETYFALAAHPNIVGCKMSHGNMSHHIQVALAPQIDHSKFRLYSGFGQQSFPVVSCGGAGVIDGLAAVFPRVVAELFDTENLPPPIDAARLEKIRTLQWNVSRGNELLGQQGVIGIREAAIRELKLGSLGAGRAPLRGQMAKGVWESWHETFENLRRLETQYSMQ